MKVWLPYVVCGSGVDVYTSLLKSALERQGHEVVATGFPHRWQYYPWRLLVAKQPSDTKIILTNSWNGFAFKRADAKLVVVEHHCVFDKAYLPYRSVSQGVFHETLVRRFERKSFEYADRIVSVSHYTTESIRREFGVENAVTIHNGVDTEFYSPGANDKEPLVNRKVRLLFVGNQSTRKGFDLLPRIMQLLGSKFQLSYTGGLRDEGVSRGNDNMIPLGRVSNQQLRDAYRRADILLFPTRLEGFGYAAAESMACGTPVVTTKASALPEVVAHGEAGLLCPINDVEAYVNAIRRLAANPRLLERMGEQAREIAAERFSLDKMGQCYLRLFEELC